MKIGKLHKEKDAVLNTLFEMDSFERIRLIDKYSKMAEVVFGSYSEEAVIKIMEKLLNLKFNRSSLIDTFLEGDPIVDRLGFRLEEFLTQELTK
jgi:hypothetical protein